MVATFLCSRFLKEVSRSNPKINAEQRVLWSLEAPHRTAPNLVDGGGLIENFPDLAKVQGRIFNMF